MSALKYPHDGNRSTIRRNDIDVLTADATGAKIMQCKNSRTLVALTYDARLSTLKSNLPRISSAFYLAIKTEYVARF